MGITVIFKGADFSEHHAPKPPKFVTLENIEAEDFILNRGVDANGNDNTSTASASSPLLPFKKGVALYLERYNNVTAKFNVYNDSNNLVEEQKGIEVGNARSVVVSDSDNRKCRIVVRKSDAQPITMDELKPVMQLYRCLPNINITEKKIPVILGLSITNAGLVVNEGRATIYIQDFNGAISSSLGTLNIIEVKNSLAFSRTTDVVPNSYITFAKTQRLSVEKKYYLSYKKDEGNVTTIEEVLSDISFVRE